VTSATLTKDAEGYKLVVTMSSPYETPERYADGWRVLAPNGGVLAEFKLGENHVTEQPFTRRRRLEIPDGVTEITVQGRDLLSGYGGATVTIPVPG